MKRALLTMGVAEDTILVEARARHSTTNLRGAGRYMITRGLGRALVTPPGGGIGGSRVFDQELYFSNPVLSTFYSRCERELGYRVGALEDAGPARVAFTPAPEVVRLNYKDPLDPWAARAPPGRVWEVRPGRRLSEFPTAGQRT